MWQEVTAWERAPAWMAGIETTRGAEQMSTITACEPGRFVTLTSVRGRVSASCAYTLAAEGSATRASLVADVTTTGAARALAPVLRRAIRHADSGQLRELRHRLEQESAPT